jgi:hypothetical protein
MEARSVPSLVFLWILIEEVENIIGAEENMK